MTENSRAYADVRRNVSIETHSYCSTNKPYDYFTYSKLTRSSRNVTAPDLLQACLYVSIFEGKWQHNAVKSLLCMLLRHFPTKTTSQR